jgi:hypothetical protein
MDETQKAGIWEVIMPNHGPQERVSDLAELPKARALQNCARCPLAHPRQAVSNQQLHRVTNKIMLSFVFRWVALQAILE